MRKILFGIVALGIITSCGAIQEEPVQNDIFVENESIDDPTIRMAQLQKVYCSLDSINMLYRPKISRGKREFVISLSDVVGGLIGRDIGSWIGNRIGSFGGPVGAAFGGFAGGMAGHELGCYYASYYVRKAYDCAGYAVIDPYWGFNNNIKVSVVISEWSCDEGISTLGNDLGDYAGDPIEDVLNVERYDSLGYFHNTIMHNLSSNGAISLVADAEQTLNEIVSEMSKFNPPYLQELLAEPEFKEKLMMMVEGLFDIANVWGLSSTEDVIEAQCVYMRDVFNMEEAKISIHRDFVKEIAITCSELSEREIDSYSQSINDMILDDIDIDYDLKLSLAFAAQGTINSALCWGNIKQ